jgi:hypothetical protein
MLLLIRSYCSCSKAVVLDFMGLSCERPAVRHVSDHTWIVNTDTCVVVAAVYAVLWCPLLLLNCINFAWLCLGQHAAP